MNNAERYSLNFEGNKSKFAIVRLLTERNFLTIINPENGVVCLPHVGTFLFRASLQLANYMGMFK